MKDKIWETVKPSIPCIIFAHIYAIIERLYHPWEIINPFLSFLPHIQGYQTKISPYNYLFLPALLLLVSYISTRKPITLIIANTLLTGLIEDVTYFYLFNDTIKPTNWTSKIMGYITITNHTIPLWYIPTIATILILYTFTILHHEENGNNTSNREEST